MSFMNGHKKVMEIIRIMGHRPVSAEKGINSPSLDEHLKRNSNRKNTLTSYESRSRVQEKQRV